MQAVRSLCVLVLATAALACGEERREAPAAPAAPTAATPPATPSDLPSGLLLALSQFEVSPEGKVLPKPGPALAEVLLRRGGKWEVLRIEDPESNVFHKALFYKGARAPGILTLGGTKAALKLWRPSGAGFQAETIWTQDFGGKFSRMRDAEVADLFGDGRNDLAVATHDQGVVAVVLPVEATGAYEVRELDREKDTFVHEIEVGDVDGDGVPEVYATPSEPNRLDGTPQSGKVVRYVPARDEGRTVVADLGMRHAKEILVEDVDGDGRDELYVAVEAKTEGSGQALRIAEPVEIRRFDAGTDPTKGFVVATFDDRLCRFLTVGDVDGDGAREMVAATFKSGLWLLRPAPDPRGTWTKDLIDRASSGFEHAALLSDLDGDGADELYVASDDQGEVRRYLKRGGQWTHEVIHRRAVPGSAITWNLMPVPAETAAEP
jgi:hypothetical protein